MCSNTFSMRWSDLVGQDPAKGLLRGLLRSGGPSGPLVLFGPPGSGKRTAGRIVAAATLCEASDSHGHHKEEPCGSCRSCREVRSGTHPDLREVEAGENLRELKLQVARDIISFLRLMPERGGAKVVLLPRADLLNEPAQNALLKSLEEPPGRTVWILTARDTSKLLPTVLSRSFGVRFGPVPPGAMAACLARAFDLAPEKAERLARAAEGDFRRAEALIDSPLDEGRAFCEEMVLPAIGGGERAGGRLSRALLLRLGRSTNLEKKRQIACSLLGALALVLRDRLRKDLIASRARPPRRASARNERTASALEEVLAAGDAIRQNVGVELVLSVLGSRLASCEAEAPAGRAG